MGGSRFTNVGLDRLLRLSQLKKVASLASAGNKKEDIKAILQQELASAFNSTTLDVRGSLDKTITILLKVWVSSPAELRPLQAEGLKLLQRLPKEQHLAIHWGMTMCVYPFWSGVATQVGRLLRLQTFASAPHVQRRVREQYGERETVSRRVRYVLRSFLDWGVLKESGEKGVYTTGETFPLEDTRLIAWLLEAALQAREGRVAPLRELLGSPSLFPFRIAHIRADSLMAASPRLEVIQHSEDNEIVMLRKNFKDTARPKSE